MENLNCFVRENEIPGGLNGLSKHLRLQYLFNSTRRLDTGYICAQNGCTRSYLEFYLLRRHIRERHLNLHNHANLQAEVDERFYDNNEMELQVDHDVDGGDNLQRGEIEAQQGNPIQAAESEPEEENENLEDFAVGMVASYQSHTSMIDSMLTNFVEDSEDFFNDCCSFFKRQLNALVQMGQIVDENLINNINTIFEIKNPFQSIKTIDDRINIKKKILATLNLMKYHWVTVQILYLMKRLEVMFQY